METTTLPAGCYVDGSWGHYAPARAVLVMLAAGWSPPDAGTLAAIADDALVGGVLGDGIASGPPVWRAERADALALEAYGVDALEALAEASDAAAYWADDRVPPFHWCGWIDGEYGVWPTGDGPDQQED